MNRITALPLALLSITASTTTELPASESMPSNSQATARRPNIILFMVDDMGWQDTSLPFGPDTTAYNRIYHTPAMQRLASQGMMFTQAYANSISSPTRCSLMTGANVARHRVTNWTLEKDKTTDGQSDLVTLPSWNVNGICQTAGIPRTFQATSFVELLKDAGYHTIHCGKAHFGAIDTPGANPHHMGFEVNIAGHAAGGLASYLGETNYGNCTDGHPTPLNAIPGLEKYWGTGTFATEALTREAIGALDDARRLGQPFYLYLSHYAIHIPINRDARFYQKYIDRGLSEKEAAYAALVEGMDKSLGDLMEWLERTGEAQNTVLIFMSDNGGLSSEPLWRDGLIHTQNAPLNSGKGSAYEGGVREPMIVRWPAVVQPGTRCDKYLSIDDFFPTLLEMAQVRNYKTVQPIDGISFMPLLKQTGDPSKGRSLYWNTPNVWGNEGPGIGTTCAIRRGPWKLVYYYDTGRKELFNIEVDLGETEELSAQYPSIVHQLSKDLGRFLRRVDAQRPAFNSTGMLCPWPDEVLI